MAKHAKLSPSSADRWMTCPGSVALSQGIKEESSSYADEGTAAHFLGSECLKLGTDASGYVGRVIYLCLHLGSGEHFEAFTEPEDSLAGMEIDVLNKFIVDVEMADHVQVYIDYVRDLVKSTGGELFVEVSVPLTHITGEEDAYGTSDTVIIAGDEIIVVDLKYGRGVEVSAERNRQLLMYASGAAHHFALMGDFKKVRMAISQPRISTLPSEWPCTIEDLREFEVDVFHRAKDVACITEGTVSLEANLNPSEDACRWCKAKATCPALAQKVQDEIGADFDSLLTEKEPTPDGYDNELLATKMACLDLIDLWSKAVRAKVESELLSGNEVPGWKLVQGRKGSRAWANAEEAEAMLKSMRLKVEQMYDFKLISPTTAEKVLKDTPKRWARAQELIGQSEGKPSVAPVTDKRPALNVTPVADDFDAVDVDKTV